MNEFFLLVKLGFHHVWDWAGYDHLLFLTALCLPYSAHQWKKVFWLITYFTIGHSASLVFASYDVVYVSPTWIEVLIPLSIVVAAIHNMTHAHRVFVRNNTMVALVTLFFGLIHGFGFASYFDIIRDANQPMLFSLFAFALGIEAAQMALGVLVLLMSTLVLSTFGRNRRDWILVVSSMIIGILLPILIELWP
ncbi:MAG: HupE/UreJ family protein [Flavobacteriaceae bacterium]|nr:HupE/UreJ family protein [Flavobacteriaceae bacterium]